VRRILPAAVDLAANGARETWLRGRIVYGDDGQARLKPFADQDSSLIAVFAQSDALIRRLPHAPAATAGEACEYLLLDRY